MPACACCVCMRYAVCTCEHVCGVRVWRVNARTAELLQPVADKDVEHAIEQQRMGAKPSSGVLDPRDGLWSRVWLSGCGKQVRRAFD